MKTNAPLDVAIEAARRAGEVLLSYYGSLDPGDVEHKGRNDVVSRADKESEALCREILAFGRIRRDVEELPVALAERLVFPAQLPVALAQGVVA